MSQQNTTGGRPAAIQLSRFTPEWSARFVLLRENQTWIPVIDDLDRQFTIHNVPFAFFLGDSDCLPNVCTIIGGFAINLVKLKLLLEQIGIQLEVLPYRISLAELCDWDTFARLRQDTRDGLRRDIQRLFMASGWVRTVLERNRSNQKMVMYPLEDAKSHLKFRRRLIYEVGPLVSPLPQSLASQFQNFQGSPSEPRFVETIYGGLATDPRLQISTKRQDKDKRVDFGVGLGCVVGKSTVGRRDPLTAKDAGAHIFGYVLIVEFRRNYRRIKTQVSPCVVLPEPLQHYRAEIQQRYDSAPAHFKETLLKQGFDMKLDITIRSPGGGTSRLPVVNTSSVKWSFPQMLADWVSRHQHDHLNVGDLVETGPIYWSATDTGSVMTGAGLKPGDELQVVARCARNDIEMGFGALEATIEHAEQRRYF